MKYKFLQNREDKEIKKNKFLSFMNKILIAIILGLVSLITMEYSPKFKEFMHNEILDNNFSFAFLGKLYKKYFGEILPQQETDTIAVFNERISFTSKEEYGNGYKLMVDDNYLVPNLTSGIVVFIGDKEELGSVIVIEGEDGSTITYGNINNSNIKLYDYLQKGSFLGEVNGNCLYLIIQKNGNYENIETYLS